MQPNEPQRNYINRSGERVTYQETIQEALAVELHRHAEAVAKILTPAAPTETEPEEVK